MFDDVFLVMEQAIAPLVMVEVVYMAQHMVVCGILVAHVYSQEFVDSVKGVV